MKKLHRILIILSVIILLPIKSFAALGIEDRVESYIIGDFESGKVLIEYNADEPMNMASVSKLMTYLVVEDEIDTGNISHEDRVTVTPEMEAVGGSNFRLLEGEVLTVEDLLKGLMVVSGNDAAYALAVHTAGSEEAFVEKMNAKAAELGYDNSKFVNASGLQSDLGQNTMTTKEIFMLSRHIIEKHPQVLEYASINILNMPERNYSGQSTLPLLGLPGVDGLKTGFTDEAGYCLVSTMDASQTVARENYRVITVVMGTANLDERRDLSRFLLDYSLDNFHMKTVVDPEMPYEEISVNSAKNPLVPIYPSQSYELLSEKGESFNYEMKLNDDIKAPVKKGEVLGQLVVSQKGEEVVTVDLISKYDIEEASFFTRLMRSLDNSFSRLLSFLRK